MTIDSAISLKVLKQINKKVIGNWTYYYLLLLLKLTSLSKCYSIKGSQEYKIGWRTPSVIFVWCFGLQHIIKEKTHVFSLFLLEKGPISALSWKHKFTVRGGWKNSKHCPAHCQIFVSCNHIEFDLLLSTILQYCW